MNAQIVTPPPEEETKYPHFRLLRGGKGPPINTEGKDWLSPLERGTAFACKRKGSKEFEVQIFVISFKHSPTMVLVDGLNPARRFGVDPAEFCKQFNLFEILGKEEADIQPEGEEDGSEGTVRSGVVEDDADAT